MKINISSIRHTRSRTGFLIASAVVASAAVAICVSATSNGSAPAEVTPINLDDPQAVQEALAFDPFDFGEAAATADATPTGGAILTGGSPEPFPQAATPDVGEDPVELTDLEDGLFALADPEPDPVDLADAAPAQKPGDEPSDDKSSTKAGANEPSAEDAKQAGEQAGTTDASKAGGKMTFGVGAAIAGIAGAAGVGGAVVGVALSDTSDVTVRSPSTP